MIHRSRAASAPALGSRDAVCEAGQTWEPDDVDPPSGEALSHRLGCQVIDAQSSPSAGPSGWTIGGVPYSLRIVPVLTNETCAELEPYRYPIE